MNEFCVVLAGDRAAAVTRAQELEKELKAVHEGTQKQLQEAADREMLQTHRLRALSHVMGGNFAISMSRVC